MNTNKLLTASLAILVLSFSSAAFSAAYIKIGDIQGESQGSKPAAQHSQKISPDEKPAALLLPAVQQAREAATRSSQPTPRKKGNVEYSWKVEEGTK